MKHFFAFCRRNRLFAALLAAELAVVCALAAGLFGAPYKLTLTPGDFTNTLPDIAAADDDGLKIWNQIGYHSDDPMTFSADNIALPSGAYEVTVRYFSCQTPDAPTFNMLNAAGSLTFASVRSPAAVTFDALRLDDCHRSLATRLWVGFGARMQDLTATVTYDQGQLYIYSITLTEQPIYRAARLLCFLVLFAAADAALLLLFAHVGERGAARRRALRLPLALAGITLLACLPLFSNYLYFGHDLEFHMQRITAMAAELSYGQFPVRLTTTTLNGYGYASPLCYCELFLLLPALLYNLWLPLRTCYQVYLFAVTLATCLIAYFSFAKITASRRLGLLGALLYTLSAYRLTCVYTRAAVGEFTAMAFFPLVLLGLYGIYTSDRPRFGDWLPMALGMAAMVQSHLLSCELTALLLILFCLLRLRETLRPARLLAWVKAALLAVGLSAWYLFPFFISTRSIPFLVNRSDLVGKLQKHGLYAVQLFSFFGTAGGSSAEGTTHDMALTPGLPLLLARPGPRGHTPRRKAPVHCHRLCRADARALAPRFPVGFCRGLVRPRRRQGRGNVPVPVPLSLAGHAAALRRCAVCVAAAAGAPRRTGRRGACLRRAADRQHHRDEHHERPGRKLLRDLQPEHHHQLRRHGGIPHRRRQLL